MTAKVIEKIEGVPEDVVAAMREALKMGLEKAREWGPDVGGIFGLMSGRTESGWNVEVLRYPAGSVLVPMGLVAIDRPYVGVAASSSKGKESSVGTMCADVEYTHEDRREFLRSRIWKLHGEHERIRDEIDKSQRELDAIDNENKEGNAA